MFFHLYLVVLILHVFVKVLNNHNWHEASGDYMH